MLVYMRNADVKSGLEKTLTAAYLLEAHVVNCRHYMQRGHTTWLRNLTMFQSNGCGHFWPTASCHEPKVICVHMECQRFATCPIDAYTTVVTIRARHTKEVPHRLNV